MTTMTIYRLSFIEAKTTHKHRDFDEEKLAVEKAKAYSLARDFAENCLLVIGEKDLAQINSNDLKVTSIRKFEKGKEVKPIEVTEKLATELNQQAALPATKKETDKMAIIKNNPTNATKTSVAPAPKAPATPAPKTVADKAKAGGVILKEVAKAPAVDNRKAATSPTVPASAEKLKAKQATEKPAPVAKGGDKPAPAAKTPAKKAEATPAKPEKVDTSPAGIIRSAFEVRSGSNRELLLNALIKKFGKPVSAEDLATAVYDDAEQTGPLAMVMKGLLMTIDSKKLKYVITKSKEGKNVTFTFAAKGK